MTNKRKDLINRFATYAVMWSGGVEVENQNLRQCADIAERYAKEELKAFIKWHNKEFYNYEELPEFLVEDFYKQK